MDEYKTLRDAIWAKKIVEGIEHQIAEIKVMEKVENGNYVFAMGENGNLVICRAKGMGDTTGE